MPARFAISLLGFMAVWLILQALFLQQAWAENPFAKTPLGDSEVYWNWAERIADGEWIDDEPFQSAPLYPYFLGLLRKLGLGLIGVYAVQALLGGLTLLLIADATRLRAGPLAGVLAGVLWLFFDEAAFAPGRIWNLPLQLFTGSLLLWYAVRFPLIGGMKSYIGLGLCAGLATLANPALLPVVLLLLLWAAFAHDARNIFGGCLAGALLIACLAPVTIHNQKATGETILLSAHAGLTFAHGNSSEAQGTYTPVPGIAENRRQQNQDALRMVEKETGERSWSAVNSYFFGRGLDWMLGNPADALVLEARKFWWLMSGRYYADLYNHELERRQPFGSRYRLAPLSLAVLLPLAFGGLVWALRRDGWKRRAPDLLLILGPALVVLVFWYSPRYRLPLAPAAILLAAETLAIAWQRWRAEAPQRLPLALAASAIALAVLLGMVNRVSRFDHPSVLMPAFLHSVGDTMRLDDASVEASIPYLEDAIERGFDNANSRYSLSLSCLRTGQLHLNSPDPTEQDQALDFYFKASEHLRHTVELQRSNVQAQYNLASLELWLWQLGHRDRAQVQPRIADALAVARETGEDSLAAQLQQMLAQL